MCHQTWSGLLYLIGFFSEFRHFSASCSTFVYHRMRYLVKSGKTAYVGSIRNDVENFSWKAQPTGVIV